MKTVFRPVTMWEGNLWVSDNSDIFNSIYRYTTETRQWKETNKHKMQGISQETYSTIWCTKKSERVGLTYKEIVYQWPLATWM